MYMKTLSHYITIRLAKIRKLGSKNTSEDEERCGASSGRVNDCSKEKFARTIRKLLSDL